MNRSGNHGLGPRARFGIEEIVGGLAVDAPRVSVAPRAKWSSIYIQKTQIVRSGKESGPRGELCLGEISAISG